MLCRDSWYYKRETPLCKRVSLGKSYPIWRRIRGRRHGTIHELNEAQDVASIICLSLARTQSVVARREELGHEVEERKHKGANMSLFGQLLMK